MEPQRSNVQVMEGKLKYLSILSSGMEAMLASGQHSDVTVEVGERRFLCHKVVLGAVSPYFEAMFSHDMRENLDNLVTLHDIDQDIFDSVLQYIYTGENVVCELNVEKVFQAASLMQIPCLQERCEEFLLAQASYENCIGIWKIAKAHNRMKLADKVWITILENFPVISTTEDFPNLDADELVSIISSDDLNSPSEEFVCDVAMQWIDHSTEARQEKLHEILASLHLPLVSSDYLFNLMDKNPYIKTDSRCMRSLLDALRYHTCVSRRQDFTSPQASCRQNGSKDDVLVVIGGLLSTTPRYQTTKEVLCFSFQQHKWFYLPSLPYDPGYEFAACTYADRLFISGGWLKLQGMAEYKTHKNQWEVCASLCNGRCGHVMVAVTDSIFVIGGRDGRAPAITSIEEFSLQTEKWTNAGDLVLGVRSTSASVIGEKVFVFGGITESDKDSNSVQCFDSRMRTCTIIGDLPFTCRLTRTVSLDTNVYVLAPDGRVLQFKDPTHMNNLLHASSPRGRLDSSNSDTSVSDTEPCSSTSSEASIQTLGKLRFRLPNFSQHHFEVIQYRGKILLVGGKTPDNNILKNVKVIDLSKKILEIESMENLEMPSARWCFGCVKTVIRRDYLNNEICV
ncbi:kelch-like protein 24 [Pecten maximus]|uniref:kelch-like protein 24 n=1 Tax=Pecten maximus TaxID=6579 RepID=UPI001458CA0A|nr:kelch-like protein 24 [Pecten maximus]